ncbi:hypothetical protein A9Q84_00715 [Halobacteriovorax marinus]|uniref:Outer membrane protein beta-barrel domain-containing protein n=1 Tax=Halobacteriovorax marinus TaxID=97084 RepID=A0A1Y5FH97_9BACT|nr:hypothetical protein A9Q84_00715 [Halobacteriovorax marinus]
MEKIIKRLLLLSLCLFIPVKSFALVGIGGYVPFGLSTQKTKTGSRRTLSAEPYILFNTTLSAPFNQIFMPEFGYVFHATEKFDDYDKSTMFLLADFGYQFSSTFILRYGLGLFRTSIGGDGATVTLSNGSSTATFYRPSETSTSYNTTWNIGLQGDLTKNYAMKFQFYLFDPISSTRDVSYSLSVTYNL